MLRCYFQLFFFFANFAGLAMSFKEMLKSFCFIG